MNRWAYIFYMEIIPVSSQADNGRIIHAAYRGGASYRWCQQDSRAAYTIDASVTALELLIE
jgi:hypothetical protein